MSLYFPPPFAPFPRVKSLFRLLLRYSVVQLPIFLSQIFLSSSSPAMSLYFPPPFAPFPPVKSVFQFLAPLLSCSTPHCRAINFPVIIQSSGVPLLPPSVRSVPSCKVRVPL